MEEKREREKPSSLPMTWMEKNGIMERKENETFISDNDLQDTTSGGIDA